MSTQNLTNKSWVFKSVYKKICENVYNSHNVTEARIKKSYDFTGKEQLEAIPQSFAGGVGSGSLPTAGYDKGGQARITRKKLYAVCEIDREAIKAADGDKGSFVKFTKQPVEKAVESYNRNNARIFWNTLDNGQLGVGDGSTAVTGAGTDGDPYLVKMSATGWKEANWEEMDYVNCGTETTLLLVKKVVPSTRVIHFVGTSAALAAAVAAVGATSAKFYMQGSKDNDHTSFMAALTATSGTLYGLDVERRWQASVQADASGAGLTTDMMNEDMLEILRKTGKSPDLIKTSFKQYRKLLNMLEDKKDYIVEPRAGELKGKISFKGLEFQSAAGAVPIFPERFVDDGYMVYMNTDFVERRHAPDFGWFDDDGTVFLRKSDADAYEARYGGYLENYVVPNFHGYRKGLA
jgi:hypothetical protein